MKLLKFLLLGAFFGVLLTKGQIVSWYKIYEMFRFQSFHMYGIIGSAVFLGALGIFLVKRNKAKDLYGEHITIAPKTKTVMRYLIGGSIFGFGWALTGACPGPLFAIVGDGFYVFLVVILSATLGTFVYGVIQKKLPH